MREILTDEERRGAENMSVRFMGYLVPLPLASSIRTSKFCGERGLCLVRRNVFCAGALLLLFTRQSLSVLRVLAKAGEAGQR